MTFEEKLTDDMGEYLDEYYYYGYETHKDGFTCVVLIRKRDCRDCLLIYYDTDGYMACDKDTNLLFKTKRYYRLVDYINGLDWEA